MGIVPSRKKEKEAEKTTSRRRSGEGDERERERRKPLCNLSSSYLKCLLFFFSWLLLVSTFILQQSIISLFHSLSPLSSSYILLLILAQWCVPTVNVSNTLVQTQINKRIDRIKPCTGFMFRRRSSLITW